MTKRIFTLIMMVFVLLCVGMGAGVLIQYHGDIIPDSDQAYTIGTSALQFQSLWVHDIMVSGNINQSGNTLNVGGTDTAKGLSFDASGNATAVNEFTFSDIMRMNENIDLDTNYISDSGADSRGLSFDTSGNAKIWQELICTGKIRANENIDLDNNYMNDTGADSRGLSFNSYGDGVFASSVRAGGDYYINGIQGDTDNISVILDIRWNGSDLEYKFVDIIFEGGLITGYQEDVGWTTVPN